MRETSICLYTKHNFYCDIAVNFVKTFFPKHKIVTEHLADLNPSIYETKFDYIIAFLYHKLIPESILKNATIAAVNFHPAPTHYPGGTYSHGLYNNDKLYGTTCHHMVKKADAGTVVSEKKFPLYPEDTFVSLKQRTMVYTLANFFELMNIIIEKKELPVSAQQWTRQPYRHKEFETELLELRTDMPTEELDRKIRATAHPDYPGPFIEINGKRYTLRSATAGTPYEYGL